MTNLVIIKVEDSLDKDDTYSAQPIDEDGYKYQTSTHMRVSILNTSI